MCCPYINQKKTECTIGKHMCLSSDYENMWEDCNVQLRHRMEKAESKLFELGVGDCDYCHEQKENIIKEIKKEEEAISEKIVKENQELGIKLAKAESELKAIKDRIEAVTDEDIFRCLYQYADYMDATIANLEQVIKIKEFIKQIGGVKWTL